MSFANDIDKFAKESLDDADEITRAAVFQLFGAVIKRTPVDSGRLVNNWQVGTSIPESVIDAEGANISALLDEAKAGTESWDTSSPIYIVNNLQYAPRIEYEGWSKIKAPRGMVRISIAEFNESVKTAVAEVAKT